MYLHHSGGYVSLPRLLKILFLPLTLLILPSLPSINLLISIHKARSSSLSTVTRSSTSCVWNESFGDVSVEDDGLIFIRLVFKNNEKLATDAHLAVFTAYLGHAKKNGRSRLVRARAVESQLTSSDCLRLDQSGDWSVCWSRQGKRPTPCSQSGSTSRRSGQATDSTGRVETGDDGAAGGYADVIREHVLPVLVVEFSFTPFVSVCTITTLLLPLGLPLALIAG